MTGENRDVANFAKSGSRFVDDEDADPTGPLEASVIVATAVYAARRRLMVDLTESGHRVLERAIKLQCERLLSWTAKLSGDELTQLRELMNHLVNQPHPD